MVFRKGLCVNKALFYFNTALKDKALFRVSGTGLMKS